MLEMWPSTYKLEQTIYSKFTHLLFVRLLVFCCCCFFYLPICPPSCLSLSVCLCLLTTLHNEQIILKFQHMSNMLTEIIGKIVRTFLIIRWEQWLFFSYFRGGRCVSFIEITYVNEFYSVILAYTLRLWDRMEWSKLDWLRPHARCSDSWFYPLCHYYETQLYGQQKQHNCHVKYWDA